MRKQQQTQPCSTLYTLPRHPCRTSLALRYPLLPLRSPSSLLSLQREGEKATPALAVTVVEQHTKRHDPHYTRYAYNRQQNAAVETNKSYPKTSDPDRCAVFGANTERPRQQYHTYYAKLGTL